MEIVKLGEDQKIKIGKSIFEVGAKKKASGLNFAEPRDYESSSTIEVLLFDCSNKSLRPTHILVYYIEQKKYFLVELAYYFKDKKNYVINTVSEKEIKEESIQLQ
jgi:hypothetical protein